MSINLQKWRHENPRQIYRFARVVVQRSETENPVRLPYGFVVKSFMLPPPAKSRARELNPLIGSSSVSDLRVLCGLPVKFCPRLRILL
jgi:hypothetical protein